MLYRGLSDTIAQPQEMGILWAAADSLNVLAGLPLDLCAALRAPTRCQRPRTLHAHTLEVYGPGTMSMAALM